MKYKIEIFIGVILAMLFIGDRLYNSFNKYEYNVAIEHTKQLDVADSVVNVVSTQLDSFQSKQVQVYEELDMLDHEVEVKEMTIEDQVKQLKLLLKESNEAKAQAIEQQNLAIIIKQQAEMSKMEAHQQQQEAMYQYKLLADEKEEVTALLLKQKEECVRLTNLLYGTEYDVSDIPLDTNGVIKIDSTMIEMKTNLTGKRLKKEKK